MDVSKKTCKISINEAETKDNGNWDFDISTAANTSEFFEANFHHKKKFTLQIISIGKRFKNENSQEPVFNSGQTFI